MEVPIRIYTDADWANNEEDRKSVSGLLIQVYGASTAWQTKRQRIVSKSSTVAEYLAVDDGVEEALWTKLLVETLLKVSSLPAIPLMMDNKSTIKRLTNGKGSEAQKTVDCRYFSIRDAISHGHLNLQYCPTTKMLADGFTKALGTSISHRSPIHRNQRCRGSVEYSSLIAPVWKVDPNYLLYGS